MCPDKKFGRPLEEILSEASFYPTRLRFRIPPRPLVVAEQGRGAREEWGVGEESLHKKNKLGPYLQNHLLPSLFQREKVQLWCYQNFTF